MLLLPLLLSIIVVVAQTCHPECRWQCNDPVCFADCKPACEKPNCTVVCDDPADSFGCGRPHCRMACPEDMCEADSCPACAIECTDYFYCPHGREGCAVECEEPVCAWECTSPVNTCALPHCELQCEEPACAASSAAREDAYTVLFAVVIGLVLAFNAHKHELL